MVAGDKSLECIRTFSLTQKILEVTGYVIKSEINQALEFLPPEKEMKVNYTASLLLGWFCSRL